MTSARSIPAPDTNLLWARSGGTCAFPECRTLLVTDWTATEGPTTLGRRAHIRAHSEGGPRHEPDYPPDLLDRYPNLLLLCSPHHDIVDRNDSIYTIGDLEDWKASHESWVAIRLRQVLPTTPPGLPPPLRHFVEVEDVQLLAETTGVVVLTGPPGSGKTALASEVYHRYGQRFDVVWWVRCARRELLDQDVVDLVSLLSQTETPAEPEDAVRQLHGLLTRVENALIILDGVQDIALAEWLVPASTSAHVIATTQRADGLGVGTTVQLGGLSSERSSQFFVERLSSDKQNALESIAEVLSGLPLALEQAASYMTSTAMDPEDYLDLLTTRTADVLQRGAPAAYGTSVVAAVSLTLDTLSPDARDAIELMSPLGPDNIPLHLLLPPSPPAGAPLPGVCLDRLRLEDAVAELRDRSLIERSDSTLRCHSLIQRIVRTSGSEDAQRRARVSVLLLLAVAAPEDDKEDAFYEGWSVLLPHVFAALDSFGTILGVMGEFFAPLLNRAGLYLAHRGEFDAASSAFEKAHELLDAASQRGTDFPDLASLHAAISTNEGNVARHRGDFHHAETKLREAIALKRTGGSPDRQSLAISIGALGDLLVATGDFAAAALAYEEEAATLESSGGPAQSQALIDQGFCLERSGAVDAGARLVDRGIKQASTQGSSGARVMARALLKRAEQARTAGSPEVAILFCEVALAALGDSVADDDRLLADVRYVAAPMLVGEDPARAEQMIDRSIEVLSTAAGTDPAYLARAIGNRGTVRFRLGRIEEAIVDLEDALRSLKTLLGPDDQAVAIAASDLGWVLFHHGSTEVAVALTERALAIARNNGSSEAGRFEANLLFFLEHSGRG